MVTRRGLGRLREDRSITVAALLGRPGSVGEIRLGWGDPGRLEGTGQVGQLPEIIGIDTACGYSTIQNGGLIENESIPKCSKQKNCDPLSSPSPIYIRARTL